MTNMAEDINATLTRAYRTLVDIHLEQEQTRHRIRMDQILLGALDAQEANLNSVIGGLHDLSNNIEKRCNS